MDLIAEILETDRLAEERLRETEERCRQMLEDAKAARQDMETGSQQGEDEYSEKLDRELDVRKTEALHKVREKEKSDISALEQIFEKNGSRWSQEIFERITAKP